VRSEQEKAEINGSTQMLSYKSSSQMHSSTLSNIDRNQYIPTPNEKSEVFRLPLDPVKEKDDAKEVSSPN